MQSTIPSRDGNASEKIQLFCIRLQRLAIKTQADNRAETSNYGLIIGSLSRHSLWYDGHNGFDLSPLVEPYEMALEGTGA